MRLLFTDGTNSLGHVLLGFLQVPLIFLVFTLYQVTTDLVNGNANFFVDMAEFGSGWMLARVMAQGAPPLLRMQQT